MRNRFVLMVLMFMLCSLVPKTGSALGMDAIPEPDGGVVLEITSTDLTSLILGVLADQGVVNLLNMLQPGDKLQIVLYKLGPNDEPIDWVPNHPWVDPPPPPVNEPQLALLGLTGIAGLLWRGRSKRSLRL